MSTERDLWRSTAEIFEADGSTSGSTGIVGLTGKANPFREWGDPGMEDRPVIAGFTASSRIRRGTKDALVLTVQLSVFCTPNSTGLEDQIADRIESVFTQSNLNSTARTSPVDVLPYLRGRRRNPELDEGRRRVDLEYECWHYRTT